MFYENYLNSLKPDMSFIPESASFKDMSIFTNRAIQDAYNEAVIGITGQEIAFFRNSVVNEADGDANPAKEKAVKTNFMKKIGEWISAAWKKVTGFFNTIINKIKELFTRAALARFKGSSKDFKNALSKLSNVEFKGFLNVQYKIDIEEGFEQFLDKSIENVKKLTSSDKEGEEDLKKIFFEEIEKDEKIKRLDEFDPSKFKAEKGKDSKVTLAYIKKYEEEIGGAVFTGKDWLGTLSISYKSLKKLLDDSMNNLKNTVNGKPVEEIPKALSNKMGVIQEAIKTTTKYVGVYNSMNKAFRSSCVIIVAKVLVAGGVAAKEENKEAKKTAKEGDQVPVVKNESTEMDSIEEAFSLFLNEADDEESKSKKDEEEIDVEVEDDGEDVEVEDDKIEESALFQALVEYLD